jgi:hypothetical protein
MSKQPQNLANHARFDPLYHGFIVAVFLANLGVAIYEVVHHSNLASWWFLFLSIAFIAPIFKLRLYPLKVQDRVIRLEERLRLQALAPVEWHAQIYRLTEQQLIALRFAADDEVVGLARQALEHSLTPKQIKERIGSWRADEFRV